MLTPSDVDEIEAVALKLQLRDPFATTDYRLSLERLHEPVLVTPVWPARSQSPDDCLDGRDLRADYSPVFAKIEAHCYGVTMPRNAEVLGHIVRVLGHEALHAVQYASFATEQIAEAVRLAANARRSGSVQDYEDYVNCDVELPAHAVMIALELRGRGLVDFDAEARLTDQFRYFESKLRGAPLEQKTLNRLLAAAKPMHAQL